ncbi:MAG: cysteine desulfurase [Acidobacteria bacterium]|nr:cysteine desulfurase [Acidobacteriota bacterium]
MVAIYLDHNATTRPHPDVVAAMTEHLASTYGNASSIHSFGQRAKSVMDDARSALASLLQAEPTEVVFTSGGTEADNLAIRGAADALDATGRRHIVTTAIEHEAVLNTVKALERRGWTATYLKPGADGIVPADAVRDAMTPATALVSVMHANNEIGTLQPIAEIAPLVRSHGALLHTDAVQTVGRIPVSVRRLGADLVSLSGHKFGGPKGVGALWVRRGVRLVPQMTGGRHERSRRAGTESVPALAGLGVAAARAAAGVERWSHVAALRDRLEAGIIAAVPGTTINGDAGRRLPNTTNISFDGVEAEALLIALDLEGIAVSTGSACSSGSLEPSHVLRAMNLPLARATNALRFSLGPENTDEEVAVVLRVLPGLVSRLRRIGRPALVR